MIGELFRGFDDARRGMSFLAARPALWKWLIAPFVVSGLLLVAIIWALFAWIEPALGELLGFLPGWLSVLVGAVKILLFLLLLVGGYFVYVALAMLFTAPFCEFLSEAIEEELTGSEGPPTTIAGFVRDIFLGLSHAVRRFVAFLITALVLFVVGAMIPAVGPLIALVLGVLATARATAFDAYDAVWARKSWSYPDKMSYLEKRRGRTYGLGGAIALFLAVPLLNLCALPLGAAGATLAYLDEGGQGIR